MYNGGHDVSHWNAGWRNLDNVKEENRAALEKMLRSSYWISIERYLKDAHGSLANLTALELGCGRAVASAAMAKQGVATTLVDMSEAALNRAREFYANNGLDEPVCIVADALELPESMLGVFDVVGSFGLAEHFEAQERAAIFRAHAETLRLGGSGVISVPNRLYLPAQIYKFISERLSTWPYGFERDFTPRELARFGKNAGFSDCQVVGSEVIYDLYSHTIRKLPGFVRQVVAGRTRGPVTAKYREDGRYALTTRAKSTIVTSPLDPILGFTITLLGQRDQ